MQQDLAAKFAEALAFHQAGDLPAARLIYERILTAEPNHAGALHLFGALLHQTGQSFVALDYLQRARELRPQSPYVRNNLGAALQATGNERAALAEFGKAIELLPSYSDALENFARAACDLGEIETGRSVLDRAVLLAPDSASAWSARAKICSFSGDIGLAVRSLHRVLEIAPADDDARLALARLHLAERDGESAAIVLEQIARTSAPSPPLFTGLGVAHELRGDIGAARHWLQRATRADSGNPLRDLRAALACPLVFDSQAEITAYRKNIVDTAAEWRASGRRYSPDELVAIGCCPPYGLCHHGENNVALKSALSDSFATCFPKAELPQRTGGPPRVAFVVTPGDEGVFCRLFLPLVEGLASKEMRVAIACPARIASSIRREITCDLAIDTFSEPISAAARDLSAAAYDVIWFNKVGGSPYNYFLAHHRLAPVQFTSLGLPDTSGVATVDRYVSSSLLESEAAGSHYRESLECVSALPYFPRAPAPFLSVKSRADFGFAERERLYLCNQKLLKYHPNFDEALRRLLELDSQGVVAIKAGYPPAGNQLLQQRMGRSLGSLLSRVRFLPWLSESDYEQLNGLADVVLDTFPAGAGMTVFDTVNTGTPFVTLPTLFNRGRFSFACLQAMGLTQLACTTVDQYVATAYRIATNSDERHHLQSAIRERASVLWDGRRCVEDVRKILLEACIGC